MIEWMGLTHDKQKIGFYSGYLAAVFFLGQFVSNFFWGCLNDKSSKSYLYYLARNENPSLCSWVVWGGKKRVLQIGIIATFIGMGLFGFSTKYWMAFLTRAGWGLFNGSFLASNSK